MTQPEVDWTKLKPSSRAILCRIIKILASDDFSGEIHLDCRNGGVRYMNVTTTFRGEGKKP